VNRLRTIALALGGLAFPIVLALAVYFASAGSLAAVPPVVSVSSETIARPSAPPPAPTTTDEDEDDEVSGNCDEAEHANDPECVDGERERSDDDDSSGKGSGDDD
jgi:hypothetical protein